MCAEARLKSGTGSLAPEYDNLSAVIAAGVHLFPFRTEKLSPPAPMVLGGQPPGRVGRRRLFLRRAAAAALRLSRRVWWNPDGTDQVSSKPSLGCAQLLAPGGI